MYEVSASVNDVKVIKIPLNENFQIDIRKTEPFLSDKNLKLIFICSPNNPTGNSMNYSDVEYIISKFNGIVVIDEAYIDFSDKPSFMKLDRQISQPDRDADIQQGIRTGSSKSWDGICKS